MRRDRTLRRPPHAGAPMSWIAAIAAIAVFAYLLAAILWPERF